MKKSENIGDVSPKSVAEGNTTLVSTLTVRVNYGSDEDGNEIILREENIDIVGDIAQLETISKLKFGEADYLLQCLGIYLAMKYGDDDELAICEHLICRIIAHYYAEIFGGYTVKSPSFRRYVFVPDPIGYYLIDITQLVENNCFSDEEYEEDTIRKVEIIGEAKAPLLRQSRSGLRYQDAYKLKDVFAEIVA